jgi:hypothetical protein
MTNFTYVARVAWPNSGQMLQPDWVNSVLSLEAWLTEYVGEYLLDWCYVHSDSCTSSTHTTLAFLRDQDRLLCLLRWAN